MEAKVALLKDYSPGEPLMVLSFHDVTEQKEHVRQMQASLQEKEVLLREIYHRVKNNLQVIQSLLKMRARSLPEGETRAAIDSTAQRVYAMALVHERLYQMEDLSRLSISAYLKDLFNGVMASSTAAPKQIKLALDTEDIPLTLDLAVPFGLLANELLSNSLKHGFPNGRRGKIAFSIHRQGGSVRMMVEDDGVGLPEGFDAAKCSSMGLKLAARLAHQLGGELQFSSNNGCRIEADLARL
jgi:two-component sensor histidine kinase